MSSIQFFDKIVFCSSDGMVYMEDLKQRRIHQNPCSAYNFQDIVTNIAQTFIRAYAFSKCLYFWYDK